MMVRWALDSGILGQDILNMVQSELNGNQSFRDQRVMEYEGYRKEGLISLLPTEDPVANNAAAALGHNPAPLTDGLLPHEYPIFTDLPAGLIDLPTAVKKHRLKVRTVHDWVKYGHVRLHGRLKAPAAGGGYLVVDEAELVAYVTAPRNKGGRPRKSKR